jgi:heterodisulfide reductase subunit A-like polyferredoxin
LNKVGAALVVGGGIGGVQSALDLADQGFKVYLLDSKPAIGGVMAQLDKTFPTNDCSMCILAPKLVEAGRNENIELITYAELLSIEGEPGNFKAKILEKARRVDLDKCTGCGLCSDKCPIETLDSYNQNLSTKKAISSLYAQAVPSTYYIERKVPPCQKGCPIHMDIREYVGLVAEERYDEALRKIRETNCLPRSLGRVCFAPCEEECNRGKLDEPIAIRLLKRFAMDRGEDIMPVLPKKNGKRIAIVGSGPSGLACAHDLALKGYGVTVYEKEHELGGMLALGIPSYRLPRDELQKDLDYLRSMGIEFKTSVEVGKDVKLEELKNAYDAVYIAPGAQGTLSLRIEGEDLDGVYPGLELLKRINLGDESLKKKLTSQRAVVVGGGNVAMDCARILIRLGCDVKIVYRRSREEMPANEEEIQEAEREGVELRYLQNPTKVLGDGKVRGIEVMRMRLGAPDATGRRRPIPIEGSEFSLDCDIVVEAIGQANEVEFAKDLVDIGRGDRIIANEFNSHCKDNLFAGGDAVTGPNTVVEAMGWGKRGASAIDLYLNGEEIPDYDEYLAQEAVDLSEIPRELLIEKRREKSDKLPYDRRESFEEVDLGFSEENGIREAQRCFSCRKCLGCQLCEPECQADAINYKDEPALKEIEVGSVILAPGYDTFDASGVKQYGYGVYRNVVTSLEFERILSASGPYQGHVERPSDGKFPNKIAFLLCVGSRDKNYHEYCSSVCCMYSIKEAMIAKEHYPTLKPTIFYMDIRAFGKEFDYYYERAKEEFGIDFKRAKVGVIEELDGGNLLLKSEKEGGEVEEEEFDMVVLAIAFEPNDLGARLGLELNEYGFIKTDDLSPMSTSRPGIYVAGAAQGPKDIPDTVAQASGAACLASSGIYEGRNSLTIKKELPPEKDVSEEEPRIGVFICHCGINIGGVVDVPEVVGYATKLPNVVYAERNLYTCSSDTQDKIKEMVKEHDLNRVIVASCTPRTHEPLFQATIREAGLNPYLFEFANIRDQCSWIHMHEPEKATEKAKDLVRMAVAKAALLEPLKRERLPVTKSALVIGGGVSGMVSALAIANQEFETYLVEKEKELGGNANRIYSHPFIPDFRERIEELKSKVENHPTIKVFKEAEIADIEGYVGNFKTKIRSGGVESEFEHGVVIVATGAKEHKPKEYLYGKDKKVMTQLELEERLYNGKPLDLSEVVMIQCVGCRNQERGYCSRVCCTGAINNAIEIRKKYPNSKVTVLFKDLRSFGFKEKLYKEASELGVNFVRCGEGMEDPKISYDGEVLKAYDLSLESDLELRPTALVLSSATVPHEENEELAKMLKVPLSRDGFFLEAHMKLRPVDFATDGIFLCGLAHWPKFVDESIAQAYGAASRALTILAKDEIESEGTVAKVDEDLCSGCGVCEVVCPYNAITVDKEEKLSHINPALCKGCGACAAACPSGAIEQLGFETKELMAMIDAEVGR